MGDNDLERTGQLSKKQERALTEARISDLKNRALEISLESMAAEFEERLSSGKLAKDMASMKTGALLGCLTRISAAIKQAAVIVVPGGLNQVRDTTALKAQSAVQLSDHERAERRKNAEAVDAEIVDP